jgi:hypothetical protein
MLLQWPPSLLQPFRRTASLCATHRPGASAPEGRAGIAGSGGYDEGDAAAVAAAALSTGRATLPGRLRHRAPRTCQGAADPWVSSGAGSGPVAAVAPAPVVCGASAGFGRRQCPCAPRTGPGASAQEGRTGSGGYNEGDADAVRVAAAALPTGRATPLGRLRRRATSASPRRSACFCVVCPLIVHRTVPAAVSPVR